MSLLYAKFIGCLLQDLGIHHFSFQFTEKKERNNVSNGFHMELTAYLLFYTESSPPCRSLV